MVVGARLCALIFLSMSLFADDQQRSGDWFSGAKGWINTKEALSKERLAGQVVVIDFWTYCCINCMHVVPDLKFLEEKYAKEPFVVVGVHSGKFDQEKDLENIRVAVQRLGVKHPVAVDSDFAIWNRFGAEGWPSLAVIDSAGEFVGITSGEGHRAELDELIGKLLEQGKDKGTLAKAPLVFAPEVPPADSILLFPGKVIADERRVYVADTGHHRIVIADRAGKIERIVGNGKPALADGAAESASFNEPQGLALDDHHPLLYVADRQNHALREINLDSGVVRTLSGNGEQGDDRSYAGPAAKARLNSPWDLALVDQTLFIAMAGHHQIWRYDPMQQTIGVFAGNGLERCVDGEADRASFAQPSGLAHTHDVLYVADSESSSIRVVQIADGSTVTLAGSKDLFGFGLADGPGDSARFQHPLGVAVTDNKLLVADTYNQLLREIDLAKGAVTTVSSEKGTYFEPGGISVSGEMAFVADTNHHRIVVVDLASKKSEVLALKP